MGSGAKGAGIGVAIGLAAGYALAPATGGASAIIASTLIGGAALGASGYQAGAGIDAAKEAKKEQAALTLRGQQAASAQEAALRSAPRKIDAQPTYARDRRLRLGIAANIRTAGLAPANLQGKTLLGQ